MPARRIRVYSDSHEVTVWIYPTREAMLTAATRYTGEVFPANLGGCCQQTHDENGLTYTILVRLSADNLALDVVCHEMHHAATALYGSTLPEDTTAREVLTHANEPFAYLYSNLLSRLVRRLYALGYYDATTRS